MARDLLPSDEHLRRAADAALSACGVDAGARQGEGSARSPITGARLGAAPLASEAAAGEAVAAAVEAFEAWLVTPAPVRGALVRRFGELVRDHLGELAALITLEAGKIDSEARGEVQEVIDMCDFAVGLSRQLYGLTMASERRQHRLMETWRPLGPVAVITAFNFPMAVWSWNAAVALVCGDPVIWKPSERTPYCALALHSLLERAAHDADAPARLSQLLVGGPGLGETLADDPAVALVSATGSTRMGKALAPRVAQRLGRCLLELGGNNAAVVAPSADLALTERAVVFAAAGTAGQRCTTLRRLICHRSLVDELVDRLSRAYATLPVGDPQRPGTLVGPLIDGGAHRAVTAALDAAAGDGGQAVTGGERRLADEAPDAFYVTPALVRMPAQTEIVRTETFGPVLYVLAYDELDEAIALHNGVTQGLASSIFTNDLREAERFLGPSGSDCGIVNVNVGPSGAEIGGAFGGEKDTGGGREAGSDAWRAYMRRATNTLNYGSELPLAQGVSFG